MERYAAVLIPIYADAPHDVVFIERSPHLRRHAGEIAFPGGALDEIDAGDHERAAIREAHEEIGVPPDAVAVVCRLQPVRQRSNRFTVTPFVGIVRAGTPLIVDRNEAVAAHRVPLAAIVAPGAVHPGIEVVGDRRIETSQFDYRGLHVWGLTARILDLFVERWRNDRSGLRARIEGPNPLMR